MKTSNIIESFALVANINKEEFFSQIKEENKLKKWVTTPIKINFENGSIVENSAEVEKLVLGLEQWAKNETTLDNLDGYLDILKNDEDVARTIEQWFKGSRQQLTKPLDELKKNFTTLEKRVSEVVKVIKNKQLELQEEEFKKRAEILEEFIISEISSVKDEQNITLELHLFDDFIDAKRVTKILTSAGKLSKKVQDDFSKKLNDIVMPILREREQQKLVDNDMQKLTLDISGENDINKLELMLETFSMRYPNLSEREMGLIKTSIELITAQKKLNKKKEIEYKKEAENESILARVREFMDVYKWSNDISELENARSGLRELRIASNNADTIKKIDDIGKNTKEKINKIKSLEIQQVQQQQTVQEEPKFDDVNVYEKEEQYHEEPKAKALNKYKIDVSDIEALASIEFDAVNEDGAKKQLLNMFEMQLSIIDLELVK